MVYGNSGFSVEIGAMLTLFLCWFVSGQFRKGFIDFEQRSMFAGWFKCRSLHGHHFISILILFITYFNYLQTFIRACHVLTTKFINRSLDVLLHLISLQKISKSNTTGIHTLYSMEKKYLKVHEFRRIIFVLLENLFIDTFWIVVKMI